MPPFDLNWAIVVVTLAFNLLDVVFGLTKAVMLKSFSSTVMREGIMHKVAFIGVVALAVAVDYAQGVLDIGFSVPVTETVCALVILCEVGSIFENLGEMNPQLASKKFMEIFGKGENDGDN